MVIRAESNGSIWLLDDDRGVYMRMPKSEGPRDPYPDQSPTLDDLRWIPMNGWEVRDSWLRIYSPTGTGLAKAPIDEVEAARLLALR